MDSSSFSAQPLNPLTALPPAVSGIKKESARSHAHRERESDRIEVSTRASQIVEETSLWGKLVVTWHNPCRARRFPHIFETSVGPHPRSLPLSPLLLLFVSLRTFPRCAVVEDFSTARILFRWNLHWSALPDRWNGISGSRSGQATEKLAKKIKLKSCSFNLLLRTSEIYEEGNLSRYRLALSFVKEE